MPAALFNIRDLAKFYESREVLDIPSLDLDAGRVTALEGPNGAGKTTLLRILAMLEEPERGSLVFDGKRIFPNGQDVTLRRRQVSLVSQDPYLFEGSVLANVTYGLKVRKMGRAQRGQRAQEALAAVGLAGFGERRARDLSGGEKQRVALARALALRPKALLLDEPFANLDPDSAAVFERVISGLPGQGSAVILVSHARRQARRLAQRVLRLEQGRLTEPEPEN